MNIGFIGCGNMAKAMIKSMLLCDAVSPENLRASNSTPELAAKNATELGIEVSTNNCALVQESDIVFLTVKPQHYAAVLAEIDAELRDKVLVAVAPGKTIEWLQGNLSYPTKIVRTAPNTPAMVSEGVTGYSANELVSEKELAQVVTLIDCFGRSVSLPENLLDACSALGGSGPAYTYLFIEALADGAVAEGIPRAQAQEIAAQMVLGSAKMVLETGKHPGQLKDEVCSPGGSTIKGIEALENGSFRGTVMSALRTNAQAARSL